MGTQKWWARAVGVVFGIMIGGAISAVKPGSRIGCMRSTGTVRYVEGPNLPIPPATGNLNSTKPSRTAAKAKLMEGKAKAKVMEVRPLKHRRPKNVESLRLISRRLLTRLQLPSWRKKSSKGGERVRRTLLTKERKRQRLTSLMLKKQKGSVKSDALTSSESQTAAERPNRGNNG